MALSPEEQQQLEEIRGWWKENGVAVVVGVLLVLGSVGGYKGWQYWRVQQAMDAAQLYEQHNSYLEEDLEEEAYALGDRLRREYGSTPYAWMASLISARAHLEAQQPEEAKRLLEWVREHAEDGLFGPVATLRLARLLAAEQEWERGLEVLEGMEAQGYEGLMHELRGDLYRQAGRTAEARLAYVRAMEHGRDGNEFLALKLAEVGGAEAEDAAH